MRAVAAGAILAGALALGGCGRADHSDPASYADVEAAIAGAGLEVCDRIETEARTPGASDERRYDVAVDCRDDGEDAVVVATVYEDAEDRDGAARRFEAQVRPPAQGALWTLGPLTVRVSGDRDPDAVERLTEALDDRGAE